jgi:hypothetical protein
VELSPPQSRTRAPEGNGLPPIAIAGGASDTLGTAKEPWMQALLDPKHDSAFKRLFADSPALLIALINAVRAHPLMTSAGGRLHGSNRRRAARTPRAKLETLSNDDEARRLAFARERALLDERSRLKDAHDEGWEEGLQKGREEGKQEGKQEGRIEALHLTASNLIQATTLDDTAIAAITGLGVDDIAALRQNGWRATWQEDGLITRSRLC